MATHQYSPVIKSRQGHNSHIPLIPFLALISDLLLANHTHYNSGDVKHWPSWVLLWIILQSCNADFGLEAEQASCASKAQRRDKTGHCKHQIFALLSKSFPSWLFAFSREIKQNRIHLSVSMQILIWPYIFCLSHPIISVTRAMCQSFLSN